MQHLSLFSIIDIAIAIAITLLHYLLLMNLFIAPGCHTSDGFVEKSVSFFFRRPSQIELPYYYITLRFPIHPPMFFQYLYPIL